IFAPRKDHELHSSAPKKLKSNLLAIRIPPKGTDISIVQKKNRRSVGDTDRLDKLSKIGHRFFRERLSLKLRIDSQFAQLVLNLTHDSPLQSPSSICFDEILAQWVPDFMENWRARNTDNKSRRPNLLGRPLVDRLENRRKGCGRWGLQKHGDSHWLPIPLLNIRVRNLCEGAPNR